jgi:hypothetical protein
VAATFIFQKLFGEMYSPLDWQGPISIFTMDGKELAVWTGTCAKGTVHIDVCASAQAFKVFWGGEKQNSPIVILMSNLL